MASRQNSSSTGPKTTAGKAKSSMNALSHGLTSERVMPDEVKMVQEFTQALTDFYKPESPLEVLTIQRIALCRAKLAKLIDIELAGREIRRRQIENTPEIVMAQLTQFSQDLRDKALAHLAGTSLLDQFDLDESTLQAMEQEIRPVVKKFEISGGLQANFPVLSAYLARTPQAVNEFDGIGVNQRLTIFINKIDDLVSLKFKKANANDLLLVKLNREDALASLAQQRPPLNADVQIHGDQLLASLSPLVAFFDLIAQVREVLECFESHKSWMLRSVDLSAPEGERMMKYQTMLERRLSSTMGELLELQKYKA